MLIRYNTLAPWRAASNIQTNGDHPNFFIWTSILRIIRSYAVVLTNNYQSYTAFLLYVCCSKLPCSIFLQLFVPNDSAFALLSTPVARTDGSADEQMWNSYKYIKFNSWRVKHSIDRRTTLSPNFQSVEEETFECLLILQL